MTMKLPVLIALVFVVLSQTLMAQSRGSTTPAWPRPIPARIHDGANKDLVIMTLGDVSTGLADGVFDPLKDEERLKDGTLLATA
jgi:hypothetical protein